MKQMQEKRDQPILNLFKSMQIGERLSNILLYAIGMITNEQKEAEVVDKNEG